jgi:hypothetical protein
MLIGGEQRSSWQGLSTLEEIYEVIDSGTLLKWKEMRTLKRNFSAEQQCEIIKFMTKRLCERAEERLSAEILIESLLIWVASASKEYLVEAFLDQMFDEPGREEAARALVEISLTIEMTEDEHDEALLATAVAIVCELGLAIFDFEQKNPGEYPGAKRTLDHLATYLLSMSNYNNASIRLSLLHYFGVTSSGLKQKESFNRVMSRFGHTVLDHLFGLLFNKRSEGISLSFLLDNLPFVLEADIHSQRILHETFKYYMLKHPERFALFLQALIDEVHSGENADKAGQQGKVLLQHLGALLNIVSEVNHRTLGKELLIGIFKFHGHPYRDEMMDQIEKEGVVRPVYRELLMQIRPATTMSEIEGAVSKFSGSKRGRKPSFAKVGEMGTVDKINYLGNMDSPAKAS